MIPHFTLTSVLVWTMNYVVFPWPVSLSPFPASLTAAATLDFSLFLQLSVIPPAPWAVFSSQRLHSPLPFIKPQLHFLQILPDQQSSPSDCLLAPSCSSPPCTYHNGFCFALFTFIWVINVQLSLPCECRQWPCPLCPWKANAKQILTEWMNEWIYFWINKLMNKLLITYWPLLPKIKQTKTVCWYTREIVNGDLIEISMVYVLWCTGVCVF